MDSSRGFSPTTRPGPFPAGLRVLVVDDDPTWLKILQKMLKKCNYQVTTCNLAREALLLLRQRKDGFDIVISDVNMPDMDGFKLLEHVGLEMDLPVIMMSADGETSRVMKGVQHGACDYLLKPIRMKELKNIWQHVFRKRIRDADSYQGGGGGGDGYWFSGDCCYATGKRKKDGDDARDCGAMKKARVVWTVDLHQKFVQALNQIGSDRAGPKKILDLMGIPWLTRENVASHLQKYRLFLSRLEKEDALKAAFVAKKPPLKESSHTRSLETSAASAPPLSSYVRQVSQAKPEPLVQHQFCWSTEASTSRQAIEEVAQVESVVPPLFPIRPESSSTFLGCESGYGTWDQGCFDYRDELLCLPFPFSGFTDAVVDSLGCSDQDKFENECLDSVMTQDLYIA